MNDKDFYAQTKGDVTFSLNHDSLEKAQEEIKPFLLTQTSKKNGETFEEMIDIDVEQAKWLQEVLGRYINLVENKNV